MANNTTWKNYIYKYVSDIEANEFYDAFFEAFENKWEQLLDNYDFENLCQLKNGNRLRPMLVYWGYLLNKDDNELFDYKKDELNHVVDYCVVIETIHKISLLIDDMIDKDIARHGEPTFHTVYGSDNTVLLAVNLLLKAILDLNIATQNNPSHGFNHVHLSLETAYEMTKGALLELSYATSNQIDISTTKKIIDLETSTIIKNSLVIGYSVGKFYDAKILDLLSDIGYCCGYIFQALNDIEPYYNSNELKKHKGLISIDVSNNRKNIVYAYLISMIDKNELSLLKNDNNSLKTTKKLIKKYNIINLILDEIETLQARISSDIEDINKKSKSSKWCTHFNDFINLLIKVSKKKAFCDE